MISGVPSCSSIHSSSTAPTRAAGTVDSSSSHATRASVDIGCPGGPGIRARADVIGRDRGGSRRWPHPACRCGGRRRMPSWWTRRRSRPIRTTTARAAGDHSTRSAGTRRDPGRGRARRREDRQASVCSRWRGVRQAPLHRHVADHQADARGAHRQPVDVVADLDDVEQHPLERRRDRHLARRRAELAVRDQHPGGAGREVAADGVDAGVQPGHALHEQAIVDVGDQLGLAARARAPAEGRGSRRRASPANPPRVALPVDTCRRAGPSSWRGRTGAACPSSRARCGGRPTPRRRPRWRSRPAGWSGRRRA